MGTDWTIANLVSVRNEEFIQKAESMKPELIETFAYPFNAAVLKENKLIWERDFTHEKVWGKGDSFVLDFGNHGVGYISFTCELSGSPQDAPSLIQLKFCEIDKEIFEDSAEYNGWISKGWIQEELVRIDSLGKVIGLERRYAFRYLKIDIIDTSRKYKIKLSNFVFKKVTAVSMKNIGFTLCDDKILNLIDEVSLRTLQNCMQTVFEDGPKRDRRLWIGDLWLQAQVNNCTFKNYDLVKRCLYMFASITKDDGMVAACMFETPEIIMDDTFLLDYSLFFISVLCDYYLAAKDKETLNSLAPTAITQINIASKYLDENGIFQSEGEYHCFIDWNSDLDKQCSMQGVYLYSLLRIVELYELLGEKEKALAYMDEYETNKKETVKKFWDADREVFISGANKQISIASQIWMVIAGVIGGKSAKKALNIAMKSNIAMVTPYLNHLYLIALFKCGESDEAIKHMKKYWGGMIAEGADTFWELFNPDNINESPYGSTIINSYCHAWSCTPSYIIRKYLVK